MPFILDDMLLMAALGAGGGALFNRKNPLKGALIGGALGGLGGAVVPGLLGGAGAAAAPAAEGLGAAATSQTGLLAAQEAGLGATGGLGWGGATTGIQGGLNSALGSSTGSSIGNVMGSTLDTANKLEKPASAMMNAASQANQMAGQQQPPLQPQPLNNTPLNITGLLNQSQQMQQLDTEEQKRKRQVMQQYVNNIGRMG